MLLLGIDIGTSSVKVSVLDAGSQLSLASARFPEAEAKIIALQPGWAEQAPETWWQYTQQAIAACNRSSKYNPKDIAAIGIAYQMHGLVLVDAEQNVLRNSIIWCDSRAIETGDEAFAAIGKEKCLKHLLNSPGNFTASKLAWVKKNEPEIFSKIDKVMLPGDFISMKLTGETTTSVSALSEGVFYDFIGHNLSSDVLNYFGFSHNIFPTVQPVFAAHGELKVEVAQKLGLKRSIPVSYKAGDQPNNALSLNVLKPGEVAATAGTSGVIYGVSDQPVYDPQSRVNTFAHVNYTETETRTGVLLCINGTGSMNRWAKSLFGSQISYKQMNGAAGKIKVGSEGLLVLPFGNGAERMLNNRQIGAQIFEIDVNRHSPANLFRAVQEGIAFAFRYGLDIMRENGMHPNIIRAGRANMFMSNVFTDAFVNATGVPIELYQNDGSAGAALGAGIGASIFASPAEAFNNMQPVQRIEPNNYAFEAVYQQWKLLLEKQLN